MKKVARHFLRSQWLATCLLGACLLGGPSASFAQALDIDAWPGLAGQPQTRRELIAEYIRIPSVAHPAGTPSELNQTSFIRVHRRGVDTRHADAILIQGIPNLASAYTETAAQLVEMAALRGKNFEVWGIERREKNLQDQAGLRQAILHRDASLALHYYYGDNFLDANGKFAGRQGGPGAQFKPLAQADLPFLADWDAETLNRDIESVLDLVPPEQRRTNVFLYAASPGGYFLSQFAGFKLQDGKRGYQEIAGIIAIEGQLTRSATGSGEPTEKDIADYIAKVQAIRDGSVPRFLDPGRNNLLTRGPSTAIPDTIALLAAEFAPNQESIFPIPSLAVGGAAANEFNARLRVTNLARAGIGVSDDPLPGSFTAPFFVAAFGGGLGHLNFTPMPGSSICAVPGPNGMKPPCVPSVAQIDPKKIYGWADGGPGGAAMKGTSLEGWTITPEGAYSAAVADRGANPTHLKTALDVVARPATRSNAEPLTIDFPSGQRRIDSGFNIGLAAWYLSNRYHSVDVPFINRFQKILIDRPDLNIHLDFDKTGVDTPIIEYPVHADTANPWPGQVKDFTIIDPHGLTETLLAAQLSPMNPAVNLRFYKNVDIHTADNSAGARALAGKVTPGDVGAHPISDTLPDWIIARMGKSGVDLPSFETRPNTDIK